MVHIMHVCMRYHFAVGVVPVSGHNCQCDVWIRNTWLWIIYTTATEAIDYVLDHRARRCFRSTRQQLLSVTRTFTDHSLILKENTSMYKRLLLCET